MDLSSDIAVVGMACVFPGARNLEQFWANNVNGVDAITPIPAHRWPEISFDELPESHFAHIGCSRGGFVPADLRFDAPGHGIMPSIVRSGDPDQFVILDISSAALRDAGIADDDPVRYRTDVIIGRGGYMSRKTAEMFLRVDTVSRLIPFLHSQFPHLSPAEFAVLEARLQATLPSTDPESMTTAIPNLVASRVSNRLNLRGSAYVVDAACASSLIAVEHAVDRLRRGKCDAAIAAGIHLCQYPPFWLVFTSLRATSTSGMIRPFDRRADGLLLGEGAGAVVLKRLEDALRKGDRIYAVVKGLGSASDGRDTGVLAPSTAGQIEALRRAYADAHLDPQSISFLEAHGTATLVGDAVEIQTIKGFYGTTSLPRGTMGSVKSMIGHAMPAAGMASLIRTVLALANKTLPPTLHCEEPRQELQDSPFWVNAETRPWIHPPTRPRRAGVNAFGFGGINTHVILEETPQSNPLLTHVACRRPIQSARQWPSEVAMFSAPSVELLIRNLKRLGEFLEQDKSGCRLEDVAFSLLPLVEFTHPCKLALVCESLEELRQLAGTAMAQLGDLASHDGGMNDSDGKVYFSAGAAQPRGKVAMLFPGMVSPEPLDGVSQQILQVCLYFPELQDGLDLLEEKDGNPDDPAPFSYLIDPPTSLPEERRQSLMRRLLLPTNEVLGEMAESAASAERNLASVGVLLNHWLGWKLLEMLEVPADMACGQSLGDWAALCCAGVLDFDRQVLPGAFRGLLDLSKFRRCGCMAYVATGEDQLRLHLANRPDTSIAVHMSPKSLLLAGSFTEIEGLVGELRQRGIFAVTLPYVMAHCPAMRELRDETARRLQGEEFSGTFRIPAYSSLTGDVFPTDPDGIRRLLADNFDHPVRLWQTMRRLFDDGARIFVQAGSGHVAANMTSLLENADIVATVTSSDSRDPASQLNHLAAALFTAGVRFSPAALFRHRAPRRLHFDQPQPMPREPTGTVPFSLAWPSFASVWDARLATAAPLRPAREQQQQGTACTALPFAGKVLRLVADQEIVLEREIDLDEDLYLHDHLFVNATLCKPVEECLPVFPMAMMVEVMAEAAAQLAPGLTLIGLENVRASRWVRLFGVRRTSIRVEARLVAADPADGVRTIETQIIFEGERSACATVLLGSEYRQELRMRFPVLQSPRPWPLKAADLYREHYLFHGPRFQAISALDLLGDNGLTAALRVGANDNLFASRSAPQLLTDPCVLDGAGQLVGCWTMVRGRSVLPAGIEKIEFHQPTPPPGTEVPVRLEITSCHPDAPTVYADMEIQDGKGGVWMRIRGWTDFFIACSPKILNLQRFPQRHGIATMHPLPGLPAEAVCATVSEADLREGDADCLAILYLTPDELAAMKTMTGRRKTEYLLGRMAIKDAIRFWLGRRGGAMFHPAAMSIAADPQGKPFVVPIAGAQALPEFSVSHSDGLAMALASPAAVGIDIEPFARQTQRILADFALPEEIRLLDTAAREQPDEAWPTRLWCAKEAVGKAIGSGLGGQPRDFELLRVEREGRLRIRHRPTGRELAVTTVRDASMIVAYTVLI